MRRAPAALLAALLAAAPVRAAGPTEKALPPLPRGRWHHEVPGKVRWSVLFRRTETGDETRLLVETPAGRWVLLSTQPPAGSATREEVASPRLGEKVSRVLAHGPLPGVPECARVAPPDACVLLEGSRGRFAAPLSSFSGEAARASRTGAAAVVRPAFLADLKGLTTAMAVPDLEFYADDFLALLDPSLARPSSIRGPNAPRMPGCAFDATFGEPCSEDEQRREAWHFRRPTPRPAS